MNIGFVVKQYMKMGVQNIILPVMYLFFKKKEIKKGSVIFADAHHDTLPFSMWALYEKISRGNFNVVTFFSDYGKDGVFKNLKNVVLFMKEYANAEYVVLCDNFLPAASCKKRPETTVIQLWHACGALKKFGQDTQEDVPDFYRGNVLKNCDYVTVSSEACVPFFSGAMNLPEKNILPIGVSRTDLYYQETYNNEMRERFYKKYPLAKGKKVILWAPTFRGNAAQARVCGEEDIDCLSQKLDDTWIVIKSLHPHLLTKEERENGIITEEVLPVADMLITDYSSVIFEFLLYRKPVIRFAPDLEEYEVKRGFYMDYCSLPGRLVVDGKELYETVLREWECFSSDSVEKTIKMYLNACDGHATERILKLFEKSGDR